MKKQDKTLLHSKISRVFYDQMLSIVVKPKMGFPGVTYEMFFKEIFKKRSLN